MSRDQQMPISLAILDRQMDLPVVSVNGREALNAPYCFSIDVLSAVAQPHMDTLLKQAACLRLGPESAVQGNISSVVQLYAGSAINLYRLHLLPALMDLQQRAQRRIFQGLSVPQIVVQLLDEHGFDELAYRFEPLVGVYPPRDLCVQYDETDLHLLLRLCEEEGIHLRFEHQQARDLLVLADDPVCFPNRSSPAGFKPPALRTRHSPAISYLAERWSLQAATVSHSTQHNEWHRGSSPPVQASLASANHRFEANLSSRIPTEQQAHERQISARTLERQRCERRSIFGLSAEMPLTPGQIMQVQDHPDAKFNDQWLLTEVIHTGRQPQALHALDHEETAHILQAIKTPSPLCAPWPGHCILSPFDRGYRNSFRVLPWEMPFRATLQHHKPVLSGMTAATLLSSTAQTQEQVAHGRLPIRFDQHAATDGISVELCAPLCLHPTQVKALRTGAALSVGHVDNDPDRPLIYDLPAEHGRHPKPTGNEHPIDSDGVLTAANVQLEALQSLHLNCGRNLGLSIGQSRFELTGERISLIGTPPALIAKRGSVRAAKTKPSGTQRLFDTDLRLTEKPALQGVSLSNRLWYIVRMRQPGLEFLARAHPEDFLFEGKTDPLGYLGLGPRELRELAAAYREAPELLCLVHPGHCIRLKTWFEQNWSRGMHQAFINCR